MRFLLQTVNHPTSIFFSIQFFSIDFRPVGEIIRHDLTMQQRERLTEHIVNSVRQIHPTDLVVLLPIIMNNGSLQMAVLKTVTTFISNEMQMHIANS